MTIQTAPAVVDRGELLLLPTRQVIWGPGSMARLDPVLSAAGRRRVVLMTTRSLIAQGGLLADVEAACGDVEIHRIANLGEHTPATDVAAAHDAARAHRADAVISFGGGSVIDAAKAVVAALVDDRQPVPLHIAIPTTLSGSEFSDHFGVTSGRAGALVKHSNTREDVTAAVVVLDAELTAATPTQLWLTSAIKALDHAVEALLCNPPRPMVDATLSTGIRRMVRVLAASAAPGATAARQQAQLAAWECYIAPAAMTLGLSHRLGHILGGTYGVAHSRTSVVTLPAVLRAMIDQAPQTLANIARALDPEAPLDLDRPSRLDPGAAARRLTQLISGLGLTTRLRDVGIAEAQLADIVRALDRLYPTAAAQLGADGRSRVLELLHSCW